MQKVPDLPLENITEAVSVANCTLVIQHTKVQFDKVAAASSTSVEDNKNCLADAYAQHGLCLLTKEACCPSCTFAPVHALPPRINTPSSAPPYTRAPPGQAMQRMR
jgi:hypothetical protein